MSNERGYIVLGCRFLLTQLSNIDKIMMTIENLNGRYIALVEKVMQLVLVWHLWSFTYKIEI